MSNIAEARLQLYLFRNRIAAKGHRAWAEEIDAIVHEHMHRRPKPRERKTPTKKTKSVTASK